MATYGGKWRWIFFDGDGCFFRDWEVFANATDTFGIQIGNNPSAFQATLFFRKLLGNMEFKECFVNRFHQLMDNQLQYDQISPLFQDLCTMIGGEVPAQSNRFGFPSTVEKWNDDIGRVDAHLLALNAVMEEKLEYFASVANFPDTPPSLRCYPNPFDDQLQLELFAEFPKTAELSVFNMLGQMVFCKTIQMDSKENVITVNLPLTSGVYVLKLDQYITKIIRQ